MALLRIPSTRNIALLTLLTANAALIACTIFQSHLSTYDTPVIMQTGGQGLVLMQQFAEYRSKPAARPSANVSEIYQSSVDKLLAVLMQQRAQTKPAARLSANASEVQQASDLQSAIARSGAATSLLGLTKARLRGAFHNGELANVIGKADDGGSGTYNNRVVLQLLFGILYYYLIVRNYPVLKEGMEVPPEAKALQEKDEISAVMDVSYANMFHALCCSGPRAAHTFHATGVLDYWPACCLMSTCPCCVLWTANSFTELNAKLGGERDGCVKGGACAMCCSCCMIAKDAQTLDIITRTKTELFSVAPQSDAM